MMDTTQDDVLSPDAPRWVRREQVLAEANDILKLEPDNFNEFISELLDRVFGEK